MDKNKSFFSSEAELGNFLATSDVIPDAYDAISKTNSVDNPRPPTSSGHPPVTYKHHTSYGNYYHVLAFVPNLNTSEFLHGGRNCDLVSSEMLKLDYPLLFDFLSTKVNPSFSINKAAVNLFHSLFDDLSGLKDQIVNKPTIITGQSLGGFVAVLFTLWLQNIIDKLESNGSRNTKRPICITFGSPLVGDDAFERVISERPTWKSCFLHVAATNDAIPRLFSASNTYKYKPFGTYLFYSQSGGLACFEEHDSILGVMDALNSQSLEHAHIDYGNITQALKRKVLYRGISQLGDFNFNPLRTGITLQLLEVGVLQRPEDSSNKDLIANMEKIQERLISKKRNAYEPTKKLNDVKISLTYMEWYMKAEKSKGGYYDSYKNQEKNIKEMEKHQEIVKQMRILIQYWRTFVEEKERMPQTEEGKLRKRWLYGGTNYRRIVEVLVIAEYYMKGNTNYLAQRQPHFKLLEEWLDEDQKDKTSKETRNKAASLTEDSCFWAHVEEAFIQLRALKGGQITNEETRRELEGKLALFEEYIKKSINEFSVSVDIFLEQSSFMKWWGEYKAYKGNLYTSALAQYMESRSYTSYK